MRLASPGDCCSNRVLGVDGRRSAPALKVCQAREDKDASQVVKEDVGES
jgi:hypothetical protein